MLALIRPAVVLLLVFTALTGFAYPLVITGLVQIALPGSANGSLIRKDGRVVGSALIGQSFTSDRYFRGRLSSAGEKGYDAAASSGSNLGPLSKKLLERVAADVAALRQAGIHAIPADAVTSSASGLDPDISPSFAAVQIDRVARTRNVPADRIRAILDQLTEKPVFGLFGEVRVNVLQLNLALDAALGEAKG